jgi:hypothetical protein
MGDYFNIKRDNTYPFFCQACLVGKPLDDSSPDPRYCQECYDFLLREAEISSGHIRSSWIPKESKKRVKKQY